MQKEPQNDASPTGRAAKFKDIRRSFGRTQQELAVALGVSVKAIQSYEQGWRPVPVRVMIQLLVLLALYKSQKADHIPCWEIRKCERSQRDNCPSFTVSGGQFCWFVGSKDCRPPAGASDDDGLPCMSCPVVKRLLKSAAWCQPPDKEKGPRDAKAMPGNEPQ